METKMIGGADGLKASLVGLGCNAFGRRGDEAGTRALLEATGPDHIEMVEDTQ